MDAYGAFSDPAPSGFGSSGGGGGGIGGPAYSSQPPMIPEPDLGPQVSRTMQYANDPYAAVRANIQQSGGHTPPSYDQGGYR